MSVWDGFLQMKNTKKDCRFVDPFWLKLIGKSILGTGRSVDLCFGEHLSMDLLFGTNRSMDPCLGPG